LWIFTNNQPVYSRNTWQNETRKQSKWLPSDIACTQPEESHTCIDHLHIWVWAFISHVQKIRIFHQLQTDASLNITPVSKLASAFGS
jgi:hypothetical protein